MFYHGFFFFFLLFFFFFFFFFFFRPLISEFAERNSAISDYMVGSKCNLKMHVKNLKYPFSLQIGDPKPPFWRLRNLRTTLTAHIFGMKHDIQKSVQMRCTLGLQGVSYIVSKPHVLWYTNGFKLEVSFHPRSVNSAFHFITRRLRRRSVNGTPPNFGKRWMVGLIHANNLQQKRWGRPSWKSGCQKLLHLFSFSTTSRLDDEYLLNETWRRQSGKGVGKHVLQKFPEHWSTSGLKPDLSYYTPSLFCFVPVHRMPSMRH